jgi:hypothetical protein
VRGVRMNIDDSPTTMLGVQPCQPGVLELSGISLVPL